MNTRILTATIVVSMFVCQQVHAQDEPEAEATELEGTWRYVSATSYGVRTEKVIGQSWRFEGNRMYWRRDGDENWIVNGTFSVNPTATPSAIDFIGTPGIYRIEDGVLLICLGTIRTVRPDRFESTAMPPTMLYVLRRIEEESE